MILSEKEWALGVLELEAADKPALLKCLQKEDFMLDERSFEALTLLSDSSEKSEMYEFNKSRRLREEIEEFASRYFSYLPEKRAAELTRLQKESKNFPELKPRLWELRSGIEIDTASLPESSAADFILSVFPLPLNKRAARIDELSKLSITQKQKFRKDLKRLKKNHCKFAGLLPYLDEKFNWVKPVNKYVPQKSAYENKSESQISGWAVGLIIFFIIKLLFIIGANSNSSNVALPDNPNIPIHYKGKTYTSEELRRFLDNKYPDNNGRIKTEEETRKLIKDRFGIDPAKRYDPTPRPNPGYTPPNPRPNPGYTPPSPGFNPGGSSPSIPGLP